MSCIVYGKNSWGKQPPQNELKPTTTNELQITDLKNQIEGAKAIIDKHTQKKALLYQEIKDLKFKLTESQKEINRIKSKAQELISSLMNYNADCEKIDEKYEQQITFLKMHNEELVRSNNALDVMANRAGRQRLFYKITTVVMAIISILLVLQLAIPQQEGSFISHYKRDFI